jgi:NADPH:quinone reductase-like Zn-dependent oxidoreductase
MATMRAAVIHEVGPPELLTVQDWPKPISEVGRVLIRVKAFGLNRSETYKRQGHSPDEKFPRVLGIEACGVVGECPGNELNKSDIVATRYFFLSSPQFVDSK